VKEKFQGAGLEGFEDRDRERSEILESPILLFIPLRALQTVYVVTNDRNSSFS
jgi:hypothetical protein